MFRLRPYVSRDFEKLFRIDQECFEPGIAYSRAELSSYIDRQGSTAIVAELTQDWISETKEKKKFEKGTIVGFIVVELHPKGYGHVITIDIRPEFRRHGLGTLLLTGAETRLEEKGAFMVVLEVAVNNLAAITFYKRHNYNVARTLPRYYNSELDALFMTKRM